MDKIFTYLGRAIAFTLMLLVCSFVSASTYYISSSVGDDSRSSIQAQNENTPWKSIQKLNSIFSTLQPGDKILFKNGDTFHGTITITKSGTDGAPITFGSYGSGEKPIITSLMNVTNWTSKGGNIYEANVNVAEALNIVVLDGKAQAMGRFPNADSSKKGFLTISSYNSGNISSSELQAPTNFTGGEIVIRKNNWIIDRHYINYHSGTSINYNTTGSYYYPYVGFGFFIQNHPGTLDQNGEWYFNKQNKTIQIYYNKGNPSSANIQVALANQVIDIKAGISNITFSNLSITGANENLITLSSSSNITFDSSELKFAGKNGVQGLATTNFTIQNSLVEDTYNSALFFQWSDLNMKIHNNTFNRNFVFPGMGRNGDLNGNTIYMSETSGNGSIQYNKIHNSGYQGINFNGNNTVVKYNLVDTFCFVKDDGAGIYTYTGAANKTLSNRQVINNIVINGIGAVDGTKPYGPTDLPYVEGIYMDDNSSGVEISGNTIANIASSGIYIHNSRALNISQNNIYNVGNSIRFVHDNLGDPNRNIVLKNNNFLAKTSGQAHVFVRSKIDDVNQMGSFDNNVHARPVSESNTITIQTPSKNGIVDLKTWNSNYGLDMNTTKSPVAFDNSKMEIEEFILFEYNYSNSAKSLGLSGTYVDLKGKTYTGSVSIPAYSSVILLKTKAGETNLAPTVSISSPNTNTQITQGENININAYASDTDGSIAKVDYYNGNTLIGTDTSAPFSFTWASVPVGTYSLTAKATDNGGLSTVSDAVTIKVVAKSNVAPSVAITAPSAESIFNEGENISITANAADADGTISKVEFYNGSTLLGVDATSPYSFSWSNVPAGKFSIMTKATDNTGAVAVSAPVAITVIQKIVKSPFGGNAAIIPGIVEAENYDLGGEGIAYHDSDKGNNGGVYRVDDIDIGAASEGSYTLGWMEVSEWMEYTVNITSAGAYNLDVRVASPAVGGTFHLECDGKDVTGPLTVPATGGWNTWASVEKTGVNLPAGKHVLRYVVDSHGASGYFGNFNSMIFTMPNKAPSVSITAPASKAIFTQGENISITANAADADGTISKVEFYNGSTLLGVDITSPYSFSWTNLPVGAFSLTAKATDNLGVVTVSAPIVITVAEKANIAPNVSITAPATKAIFTEGENISITANATDSDGTISKVEFYNGSTLLGADTSSPYSISWTNVLVGSFSLTAKAIDNKGAITVSAPIAITVAEKANIAPSVAITAPSAEAIFNEGENISITANAADADGTISKVEFYNGSTLLGVDATSPYSFSWSNVPAGKFSITTKATDNTGAVAVSAPVAITVVQKIVKSPFGGNAAIIPGIVEAENYDLGGEGISYHDSDKGNNGGVYRVDDVDIGAASEGSYTLGWMEVSEWLEYTVNITSAGAYNLDARVASPAVGGTFHIECDGKDVTGPLTVPATGGWNTWASVKKSGVNLPSGKHVLRYVVDSHGASGYFGNFNSMIFTMPNKAPSVSITAPASKAIFTQGENISITANAADADGTISKVEFYNGSTLLGVDITSPYSFSWTNLPVGAFSLTAKATDNLGVVTVSAPVAITVAQKPIQIGNGLLNGLIAFYEMNTNQSNVLRDSHGQNHGTNISISHQNGFTKQGNRYDGKSSLSSVPHSNSLNLTTEFTLMADIYREGNGQVKGTVIVGKTLSSSWTENQSYSMGLTRDNKIKIRTNIPYLNDWVSTQTVPLRKWVRVIATYKSGEGYSLYMDSTKPELSGKFSGSISQSNLELTIGAATLTNNSANLRRFEGVLDNVGIWNRKLSTDEISSLITTKITYPDFKGSNLYRVKISSNLEEISGKENQSEITTEAEEGEKLIFVVEDEDNAIFDYWSINGVPAGDQSLLEFEMPSRDITLTKHFREFLAPEIKISLTNQNTEIKAMSEVNIHLEVKSNDAVIEKIELFDGDKLIGEFDQSSSDGINWKNIPAGTHALEAKITDATGKSYFSEQLILKAVDNSKDIQNVLLDYKIGPNPTTDYLNIFFTNLDGIYDFEFRVVSMNGVVQKTFKAAPEESSVTIDVSDLINGVYVLNLTLNEKNISSKKFIKK